MGMKVLEVSVSEMTFFYELLHNKLIREETGQILSEFVSCWKELFSQNVYCTYWLDGNSNYHAMRVNNYSVRY